MVVLLDEVDELVKTTAAHFCVFLFQLGKGEIVFAE